MIISLINNNFGPGKTTLLYSLILYVLKNEKKDVEIKSIVNDPLFSNKPSVKDIFNVVDSLSNTINFKNEHELIEKIIASDQNRDKLTFIDTKGFIQNVHNPVYLYSKYIIIPLTPTEYYFEKVLDLIKLINYLYLHDYKERGITKKLREKPILIVVPYGFAINEEEKDKMIASYSDDYYNILILEKIFPIIDYRKINNDNYILKETRQVSNEIYTTLFAL